ncbi:MAG: DNA-3-methyladenine glycosylase 2 family protein, partial [Pseudomonadota bacterium]
MQTHISPEQYQNALQTRDARFDGKFFIGVTSTGIYCRPVCPVRRPKPENTRYFASAAAAASEGFRPCLRCRPESAPGSPAWKGSSTTVQRALGLIESGALNDGTLEQLSDRLGVSSRHLNRLFHQHLGASPLAVAQTRRLHFAKKLLNETNLSMTDIALAAGFGSVRRFNAAFRKTYDCSPTELRRMNAPTAGNTVTLELSFRPPFDWPALLAFYEMRAIPGVEAVVDQCYHRTIRIGDKHGRFSVCPDKKRQTLKTTIDFPDTSQLLHIVERIRRQFDLYADPIEIGRQLSQDTFLQPL